MSTTKLRLALSLTSIRRRFPDDGFFNLLTQSGDFLHSQRGEFIVTQDEVNAPDFVEAQDLFLTQSGDFLHTQNDLFLALEQDFDAEGNSLETQDAQALVTQDGRGLITERAR